MVIELKERKTIISASLLAADFSALGRDCERAAEAGCDWLHFDIMDGLFVPSISFGDPVLECVGKISRLPVDVHMMVTEPVRYAERYAGFGASGITVHVEACNDVKETLNEIKRLGMRAGISLKPATPASAVLPYLPYADMVLVMTVEPGFGGQEFMPDMLSKINEIRRHADEMVMTLIFRWTAASTAPRRLLSDRQARTSSFQAHIFSRHRIWLPQLIHLNKIKRRVGKLFSVLSYFCRQYHLKGIGLDAAALCDQRIAGLRFPQLTLWFPAKAAETCFKLRRILKQHDCYILHQFLADPHTKTSLFFRDFNIQPRR